MRVNFLNLKSKKFVNKRFRTVRPGKDGNVYRSVLVGGLFFGALAYTFVTKEVKGNGLLDHEIVQEPNIVSFNDDFVGAIDQRILLQEQERPLWAREANDFHISHLDTHIYQSPKPYYNEHIQEIRHILSEFKTYIPFHAYLPSLSLPEPLRNAKDAVGDTFRSARVATRDARVAVWESLKGGNEKLINLAYDARENVKDFLAEHVPQVYFYEESEWYQRFLETKDEVSALGNELYDNVKNLKNIFNRQKEFTIPKYLLPPPLPYGQPPLTIVIDNNIIFGSEKEVRAGSEFFVTKLAQMSETVFNSGQPYIRYFRADAIFHANPPIIHHRLSANSWTSLPRMPGIQCDLSRLNRDLSKVLVISTRTTFYEYYADNLLILPDREWELDDKDTDLYDLVPVIKHIVDEVKKGKDVRDVLKHYQDVDPAKLTRLTTERTLQRQSEVSSIARKQS